jgi:ATP-binding cassette subfamily B protein
MRKQLRAAWLLLGTAFEVDPPRASLAIGLALLTYAHPPLVGLLLKLLVDSLAGGKQIGEALAVAGLAASMVSSHTLAHLGWMIRARVTEQTGLHLDRRAMLIATRLPGLEHFERPDFLNKMELMKNERSLLGNALEALISTIAIVFSLIATLALLGALYPPLLLLPLFGLPLVYEQVWRRRRMIKFEDTAAMTDRRGRHLFRLATEAPPAKELRLFGLKDELVDLYRETWHRNYAEWRSIQVRAALLATGGWLVFGAGFAGAIAIVVLRVMQHHATPGDVLLAMTLAAQTNNAMAGARATFAWLSNCLRMTMRYLWLIEYGEKKTRVSGPRNPVPKELREGLALDHVSFRYPDTAADILTEVSLRIPAGTTVALVGENGAGKTTLVKLLCRYYEPSGGQMTLDGIDLRSFDIAEWRAAISAGFQDFAQLELVAREVVGLGMVERVHDPEAVMAALHRAGASDILGDLPRGLETQLGTRFEDGVEVSIGQWQKLAVSRARMREHPLLLVLDEPTASLDAHAEHNLFERFAEASRERRARGGITVLVTHRFSTVKMADMIVVLERGRIVEIGSHHELVKNDGLYSQLFNLQARAYR